MFWRASPLDHGIPVIVAWHACGQGDVARVSVLMDFAAKPTQAYGEGFLPNLTEGNLGPAGPSYLEYPVTTT